MREFLKTVTTKTDQPMKEVILKGQVILGWLSYSHA